MIIDRLEEPLNVFILRLIELFYSLCLVRSFVQGYRAKSVALPRGISSYLCELVLWLQCGGKAIRIVVGCILRQALALEVALASGDMAGDSLVRIRRLGRLNRGASPIFCAIGPAEVDVGSCRVGAGSTRARATWMGMKRARFHRNGSMDIGIRAHGCGSSAGVISTEEE